MALHISVNGDVGMASMLTRMEEAYMLECVQNSLLWGRFCAIHNYVLLLLLFTWACHCMVGVLMMDWQIGGDMLLDWLMYPA